MSRILALAVAALCLSPLAVAAQTVPETNYVWCSLTDTGRAQAQIWASPVFEFGVQGHDIEVLNRLAGEFHRHVAQLGGAGDKSCIALPTRAEAEAFRQQQRALWDKRMYFVKVGNWHDVDWTAPTVLAVAAAPAASASRFFRCYATTTDVPGYVDRAWTVSSGVFEAAVPGERAFEAAILQANAYQEEFGAVARANGIPAGDAPLCAPYDSSAEAEKAEHDYRKLIGGFNTKYTVVQWRPSGKVTAAEPAAASVHSPPAKLVGSPPNPVVGAPAAAQAPYCLSAVERAKPALLVQTPIRQMSSADSSQAALGAKLDAVFSAVKQAYPGKWKAGNLTCRDNSSVIAGESLCMSISYSHFQGLQSALLYCNASREKLEERVRDMDMRAAGRVAQTFEWPPSY